MRDLNIPDSPGQRWLGVLTILFSLLLFASHANELMIQSVIAPGSAAATGAEADCRADELEEENLSQTECEMMVANVQIRLASQPMWFRGLQFGLSTAGTIAAFCSLLIGAALLAGKDRALKPAVAIFAVLLVIDIAGFIAVSNAGPLLRALYLEKLLLWFFIHVCFLLALLALLSSENLSSAEIDSHE